MKSHSLLVVILLLALLNGCGKPHQDLITDWYYGFFIDSAAIGLVRSQHVDSYVNTSGIGETYPDRIDWSTSLWSCSKSGDSLKIRLDVDSNLTGGSTSSYGINISSSLLYLPESNCLIDLATMEKVKPTPSDSARYNMFSWDWNYYFKGSFYDTMSVYRASSNRKIASFSKALPINLDRSGSRILIFYADSTLAYCNLADNSMTKITASGPLFVTDYRFGNAVLARLDSNDYYSIVPDLDTLSDALSRMSWNTMDLSNKVFNLSNGDYVCTGENGITVGNVFTLNTVALVRDSTRRIQ